MNPYRVASFTLKTSPIWIIGLFVGFFIDWRYVGLVAVIVFAILFFIVALEWLEDKAFEYDRRKRDEKYLGRKG
jgi:hypothetical protein